MKTQLDVFDKKMHIGKKYAMPSKKLDGYISEFPFLCHFFRFRDHIKNVHVSRIESTLLDYKPVNKTICGLSFGIGKMTERLWLLEMAIKYF